jgi:hypothetical protein
VLKPESGHKPFAGRSVKDVRARHVGLKLDGAAQFEFVAFPENRRKFNAFVSAGDKRVHARGL